MKKQELITQSSLIISSLIERINNSEEWMKNINWYLTLEEVEAFCAYYGSLPTEVDFKHLESFHQKFRIYYQSSKLCATKISPYFVSDGEIISKFEELQAKINSGVMDNVSKKQLYKEVLENLKHAKNLEIVVFIYETFLKNDLTAEEIIFKQVKNDMEKIISSELTTSKSQIINAKETLRITAHSKQEKDFTEKLRKLYPDLITNLKEIRKYGNLKEV